MGGTGRALEGRIALITGASRGIGAAIARRFAAEGAHVVLTARTRAGLEETDDAIREAGGGEGATLVEMDMRDMAAIDALAPALHQRFGRLDIMVCNAGVLGTMTPVAQIAPDEWDEAIAVNLTANWRLIRALEPLLLASDAGRAILVSSGVAPGRAYWGAYAVSKGALVSLARTWAEEMAKSTLRINVVNPGGTRTGMRAKAFPGEDPMTLKTPDEITDVFVRLAAPGCTEHGQIVNAQ
jgi:NAD(P)-dependent dehydrogenase (short-subunit alcohol dehydrogenase family)